MLTFFNLRIKLGNIDSCTKHSIRATPSHFKYQKNVSLILLFFFNKLFFSQVLIHIQEKNL
jgi:hypothetical protein